MGILGSQIHSSSSIFSLPENKFYLIDLCTHCVYHGVDWIYTFTETISMYDFRVWYIWFLSMIFQEPFSVYLTIYNYIYYSTLDFQLIISFFFDNYFFALLDKLPFNDDWFRAYLASVDINSTLYYYPELATINENNTFDFFVIENIYFKKTIQYLLTCENLLTATILFPSYLFSIIVVGVFFMVYFNYFSTSTKEDSITDHDYMVSNMTLESEEEISAIDDMLMGAVIFVYIFGWFFYVNVWNVIKGNEFSFMLVLTPSLYIVILSIPAALLYDFGVFFVTYLRGASSTPVFSMEVMYDTIAICAFFIRLCVQAVRLILMFFVYVSLHDLILYWTLMSWLLYGHESIWTDLSRLQFNFDSLSYFFILKLPTHLVYWLYEVLHTFFVVTGQFVAFFAMVFWLFFFLYTLFTFDSHEAFLNFKRNYYKVNRIMYYNNIL